MKKVFVFASMMLAGCAEGTGIKGDGKTLNTIALQKAIDECSLKGGGMISLPSGEYLTGTIHLKPNVCLNLEKGAILSGSTDVADYPPHGEVGWRALIYAEKADNIEITGEGIITGNGFAFPQILNGGVRPMLIALFDCRNVRVNSVTMKDAGGGTFNFVHCDSVDIRKVSVVAHANWNNDGFDIESRNVTISDCTIDADDDAICLKSGDPDFVVENIRVENCRLSSNCNFIKLGTQSFGGFRNVRISNCTLGKCSRSPFWKWHEMLPGVTDTITGIAGIALEVVDGGFIEDVIISDIRMQDVQTPVFIRLGKRHVSSRHSASRLKDVLIENITATSASFIASSITGVPGLRVENITLRNIDLKLKGGGKLSDINLNVPEKERDYPENRMFGMMLPAYGFYLRHADCILFDNVKLQTFGDREERHAIVADDVTQLRINNSFLETPASNVPVVFSITN
ncbi:MAG: polygalacturonase [Bacteroidales bacterium]|jgi:polygalacturonase|nr:polygalacturonase [Bacteroidales bacterium]